MSGGTRIQVLVATAASIGLIVLAAPVAGQEEPCEGQPPDLRAPVVDGRAVNLDSISETLPPSGRDAPDPERASHTWYVVPPDGGIESVAVDGHVPVLACIDSEGRVRRAMAETGEGMAEGTAEEALRIVRAMRFEGNRPPEGRVRWLTVPILLLPAETDGGGGS